MTDTNILTISAESELKIPAEVHSDDRLFEIPFYALVWFEQASDEEIIKLIECNWRGDYAADDVALFAGNANEEIGKMFDYLAAINNVHAKEDECGFECSVDSEKGSAWVHENRPAIAAYYLGQAASEDQASAPGNHL